MPQLNYLEKNIAKIIRTITEWTQPKQIIWFGSRVQGAARRYSDYDIAVLGAKMNHRTERRLKESLDQRLGIFSVDLINLDKTDPQFRKMVMQKGIIIYDV